MKVRAAKVHTDGSIAGHYFVQDTDSFGAGVVEFAERNKMMREDSTYLRDQNP